MDETNELWDRIAEAVHAENERICSGNGTQDTPLKYDELPADHRENRERIAHAVIDDLGLTVETRVNSVGRTVDRRTGIVTGVQRSRVIGKWDE